MKVRDVMTDTVSSAKPKSTIRDVVQMMKQEDCGFIPVVDDGDLAGVTGLTA